MSGFSDLRLSLAELEARQLYRHRRVVESPQGREVRLSSGRCLNFCSNDYLGLAADPRIAAAARAAIDRWGVGAGASHLITGHTAAHQALEEALADFTQRPAVLVFGSGYAANLGTINALLSAGDQVFEDRLNHASLIDGGRISRADYHWYRHLDTEHLKRKLSANAGTACRRLIVTDGTFSMDGDRCKLDELIACAHEADAWLMVDDAHGIGVHGPRGCGEVDPGQHGCNDVQVLMGTLGKAFGVAGAFVAGSTDLIETLVHRARNYIYTTAMPAALAAAVLASIEIVINEDWRRAHLHNLIARFRQGAAELGLELMPSATPIQPVLLGAPARALAWSEALEQQGVLALAIRPPTVPRDTSRLRITLTAAHTEQDVDQLLAALDNAAQTVVAA